MKINIKKYTIACLLFTGSIFGYAQDIEGGIGNETWYAAKGEVEKLYQNLEYAKAIPVLERILKKDSDAKYMSMLADCYRLNGNFEKATEWYGQSVQIGGTNEDNLQYAQMLQTQAKYSDAAKYYEKYLTQQPNDQRAKNQLDACKNQAQFNKNSNRFKITNLDFNTQGLDFGPVWNKEGLYYSSNSQGSGAIDRNHSWIGANYTEMYYTEGQKTDFSKPDILKKDASTKYHDAVPSFSLNNESVYYTRNNYIDGEKLTSEQDKIMKQGIYFSEIKDGNWINNKAFQYNNNEYDVAHPALSVDGNNLYFASNKPGGKGGMDIYRTTKTGGSWSEPINMTDWNTEGDEMFPSITNEGIIYFSSNGLSGEGGLDIFRVGKIEDGQYKKPLNMGTPINSAYDDFSITNGKTTEWGYFTSNRPGGKGQDDFMHLQIMAFT